MNNVRGVTVVRYGGEDADMVVNGIVQAEIKKQRERAEMLRRALLVQNDALICAIKGDRARKAREQVEFLAEMNRAIQAAQKRNARPWRRFDRWLYRTLHGAAAWVGALFAEMEVLGHDD